MVLILRPVPVCPTSCAQLHSHLGRTTVERVIKQLRKLDWTDDQVKGWVHRALLDCASVKYHIIHLVACVVSGLARRATHRHKTPPTPP